jgi:hypothetical protein
MSTKKKNIQSKNKTKKRHIPMKKIPVSLKILPIGFPLYASKKFEGKEILEYTKNQEKTQKDHCLMENSTWFGDFDVAISYKTKETKLYKWNVKKITNLLNINKENEHFINKIFMKTKVLLTPTIQITNDILKKIDYPHIYLQMSNNEKALFEFKFAFGYISVKEQYEFLKLIKYLINNKLLDIKTREGKSIISKVKLKINYYKLSSILSNKEKYNRLSFYYFDKYAIMNLCKIVYNKKEYNISGVYQKNDTSFWFPDFIVYKMNIQEYILFNPHKNLTYSNEVI